MMIMKLLSIIKILIVMIMIVLMVSVTWSNRSSPQGPVRRIRSTGPAGEVISPFITSRECDYLIKLVDQ